MKRLAMPLLLALLSVSMAVPGCAGKFPSDIWPALKACGSNDVSWAAATEVFGDLVEIADGNPLGETDLLAMLANDVGGAIPCLVNYFETQGGTAGAAASKFKVGHAKELRAAAARGPSACNGLPKAERGGAAGATRETADKEAARATDPREGNVSAPPAAGVVLGEKHSASPANPTFAYAGENPGTALARCERACGGQALAPPGGCLCRDGSSWRRAPPGGGSGLAGGGGVTGPVAAR